MNMSKIANVLIGLLLLCVACKNSEKETPNGFKFNLVKAGDGVLPVKEQILVFDYLLKDSKDSVWHNTITDGMPSAVMIADTSQIKTENGIVQMFRMLSKGDSVTFGLPVSKFFKEIIGQPLPPQIDSTLSISYAMKVTGIMSMEEFKTLQASLMKKKEASQEAKDAAIITKYLADKNIKAQQDTSGLFYVIHASTGGLKPTAENCVEVKYRGTFMKDGLEFDKNEKIAFPLNGVIRGWTLGIPMLGIGDSATFYIPSALGYGPQGYPGAIPPDAILIFDVKLLSVGAGYDRATQSCK
jgi:FKBP-type peptidyl-prolyl cis-trans isomerase FkpA